MRKTELAIWTVLTAVLAWGAFAFTMPAFNAAKGSGETRRAYELLLFPLSIQLLWFAGAAFFSFRSKRREPILGTLLGVGLELAALMILLIFSASSHY